MDPRFLALAFALGAVAGVWGERLAGGAVERAVFRPRVAAETPVKKPKIVKVPASVAAAPEENSCEARDAD